MGGCCSGYTGSKSKPNYKNNDSEKSNITYIITLLSIHRGEEIESVPDMNQREHLVEDYQPSHNYWIDQECTNPLLTLHEECLE